MDTTTTNPTCPECGGSMARETKPYTVKYKGLSSVVDLPGWYCAHCGEAIFVGKDMDAADRELVELKAKAENLLSPDQVRKIRKKLSLSQEEAGRLLGGGPNAFHKYESAQVTTSQAISNLLTILDADPKMLEVLRKAGVHAEGNTSHSRNRRGRAQAMPPSDTAR